MYILFVQKKGLVKIVYAKESSPEPGTKLQMESQKFVYNDDQMYKLLFHSKKKNFCYVKWYSWLCFETIGEPRESWTSVADLGTTSIVKNIWGGGVMNSGWQKHFHLYIFYNLWWVQNIIKTDKTKVFNFNLELSIKIIPGFLSILVPAINVPRLVFVYVVAVAVLLLLLVEDVVVVVVVVVAVLEWPKHTVHCFNP